jgi:gamma-glutamyl-gamma-aminobutyrate hydrolase PuuD
MKLYSAIYGSAYPFMDMQLFNSAETVVDPNAITDRNSALVVWGGGDISPCLYNHPNTGDTHADDRPSARDATEWDLMQKAVEMDIPIIGICRGAQMLCALSGGFLVQDVDNHTSGHGIKTKEGYTINVTSLHHQMMYPFDIDHRMIAWSERRMSPHYKAYPGDLDAAKVPVEPEFVYFPQVKGIAIQWHPEFMKVDCPANLYVANKVRELLHE